MMYASLSNTNLFKLLKIVTKWKINCLGECQNADGNEETTGRDTHLLPNSQRKEMCACGECIQWGMMLAQLLLIMHGKL